MNAHYFKSVATSLLVFAGIGTAHAAEFGARISAYSVWTAGIRTGQAQSADLVLKPSIDREWSLVASQATYQPVLKEDVQMTYASARYGWSFSRYLGMTAGPSWRHLQIEQSDEVSERKASIAVWGFAFAMRSEIKLGLGFHLGLTWFEFDTPLHTQLQSFAYDGDRVTDDALDYAKRRVIRPEQTGTFLALTPTLAWYF